MSRSRTRQGSKCRRIRCLAGLSCLNMLLDVPLRQFQNPTGSQSSRLQHRFQLDFSNPRHERGSLGFYFHGRVTCTLYSLLQISPEDQTILLSVCKVASYGWKDNPFFFLIKWDLSSTDRLPQDHNSASDSMCHPGKQPNFSSNMLSFSKPLLRFHKWPFILVQVWKKKTGIPRAIYHKLNCLM